MKLKQYTATMKNPFHHKPFFSFQFDVSEEPFCTYISLDFETITGYSVSSVKDDIRFLQAIIHKESWKRIEILLSGKIFKTEKISIDLLTKKCKWLSLMLNLSAHRKKGKLMILEGVALIQDSDNSRTVQTSEKPKSPDLQHELAVSQAKFKHFIDQSADAILFFDSQGKIIEWNMAIGHLTGIPKEQAIGYFIWDIEWQMMPEKTEEKREKIKNSVLEYLENIENQQASAMSGKIKNKSGQIKQVETSLFPIKVDEEYFAGRITRDVTEKRLLDEELHATNDELYRKNDQLRSINQILEKEAKQHKQTQIALYNSELKFRSFMHQSSEGISFIDTNGQIIEWNDAMTLIYGESYEDSIGQYLWDIEYEHLPPRRQTKAAYERVKNAIQLYLDETNRNTRVLEGLIVSKDNTEKFVHITVFPVKTEQGVFIGRIARDITEQRNAEIQLREHKDNLEQLVEEKTIELKINEERIRTLSDSIPDGAIFRLKRQSNDRYEILYASANFKKLTGLSDNNFKGHISEIIQQVHNDDRQLFIEKISDSIENAQGFDFEFRFFIKAGKPIWLHARANPAMDNTAVVWDGVVLDVSEKKQAEIELLTRYEAEKIMSELSTHFINLKSDKIDFEIEEALHKVAEFIGCDSGYIFEFSDDRQTFSMTHTWKRPEVKSKQYELQNMPVSEMSQWMNQLFEQKSVVIYSVDDMPDVYKNEKQLFQSQNIKSIIDVPLVYQDKVFGFYGFSSISYHKIWKDNEISMLRLIGQIITNALQHKKATLAIEKRERNYRTLFEQAADGILVGNKKGTILNTNSSMEQLTGYTKSELNGKNIAMLFSKKMLDNKPLRYDLVLGGKNVLNTRTILTKDGKEKVVEMSTKKLYDGRLQAFFRDITEKRKAEKTLRENEEKFRRLFETANDAVLLMKGKKIVDCNQKTLKMFNCRYEDIIGVSPFQMSPQQQTTGYSSKKEAYQKIKKAYEGFPQRFEWKHKRFSGELFDAEISLNTTVINEQTFLQAIVRDISQKKQYERELEKHRNHLEDLVKERTNEINQLNEELTQTNEELMITNERLVSKTEALEKALEQLKEAQSQLIQSEKMVSLGLLTAGIAHEINNPVNFISSGIEGLSDAVDVLLSVTGEYEKITSDNFTEQLKQIKKFKQENQIDYVVETVRQILKNIRTGVDKTAEIIKSLNTFSRIDDTNKQFVDIHRCIDSTLTILHHQYKDRIEIEKNYGSIPEIEGHESKLSQVFMNILNNAIQAIEGKGKITIKTCMADDPEMNTANKISMITKDKFIDILIKDTGKGMNEDTKNRIFEPFFTTKPVGKGTGLGLSIAYRIVQQHNGKIFVTSEIGKGTEFIVYLPVKTMPQ